MPSSKSSIDNDIGGSTLKEAETKSFNKDIEQGDGGGGIEMPELNGTVVEKKEEPKWRYIPFIGRKKPRDPYPSLAEAPLLPLTTAGLFSTWTFTWIQPLLVVGYVRTLQPTDLWKLPPEFESGHLANILMENFNRRRKEIEDWNKSLEDGSFKPSPVRKFWWKISGKGDGKRKVGLAWALSDTFFYRFWSGGVIKLVGDVSNVCSPLVTKELIKFGTQAYYSHRGIPGYTAPNVGVGVGFAILLWVMQIISSLSIHQFFVRSAGTGVLARAALIAAIYRRSLVLSGKARTVITNAKLVNHIGTDVSRIDFCAGFFHMTWTAPIQLIIIVVILLVNLGPSCLAGIGFLLVTMYPQAWAMKRMFAVRRKAMVWTDKRAKLIQELLGGMRVIKFFSWEQPYLAKLAFIRASELAQVRNLLVIRAASTAIAMSLPALATVVAFLVYAGTGHSQNPTIIFTSLTLFQLLRMPLMMLPMALGTITDAAQAISRLIDVFLAEERITTLNIDPDAKLAIKVEDADFIWEGPPPETLIKTKKELAVIAKKAKKDRKLNKGSEKVDEGGTSSAEVETLQLQGINLAIPKGQLWGVVGPVGSGKSSLLQGLVGEMRRTKGEVTFSSSLAYVSQQPWIQNLSLKDNILFGRPFNAARYAQVIDDAALEADIAMLPYGDSTEIGEKGITLSGGQKQRVNIARALYSDAQIVLLDDPLSAVDAHVGKHLFDQAIMGALGSRTRILVTHALHFLPAVDYIVCLEHGRITQEGTYAELIADQDGSFSKLVRDFGGGGQEEEKKDDAELLTEDVIDEDDSEDEAETKPLVKVKGLMQEEERATGAVGGHVYKKFLIAANAYVTVPLLILSLLFMQGAQVFGSYWLIYWQEDYFRRSQGFYMGIYALLGVLQALFSFLMGLCGVFLGFNASKRLHYGAIQGVMRAPMSFFDTNPIGRIMNRFSKDIDTIDNTLNDALRMALSTFASVLGSIILIGIIEHYFLIAVFFIIGLYYMAAQFYRQSARELKRLDNLLRSSLYAHFGESLSGLATVRAYGENENFLKKNAGYIDIENRAYLLTVINQRWLGFRLDFFGSLLTFIVAIIGVAGRNSVSPSEIGLILSYILTIQQAFSWMVRQMAEVENDMNSVERVQHYANELEQEKPAVIEGMRPPPSWPSAGEIVFKDAEMRYRPELPPVLKGLNLKINAGEKIGVIGRTGAGKSSIMMTLFRIVELSGGSIEIDGLDISKMGLSDLREKIAIIPQDALLFNGTIRSNLDPFGQYEDSRLWDALKRAWLVDQDSEASTKVLPGTASAPTSRFSLDLLVEDEGLNFSAGERSLVSLARALVKDSKIIALDEATASVDLRTDSLIQDTIRKEFKDKTLLCIAHRLRTVLEYDRICVMDAGEVAEFDTPINLFRHGGIFRSMCDRSSIKESDIVGLQTSFAP